MTSAATKASRWSADRMELVTVASSGNVMTSCL
jgi:hypothetical protein